MTKREICEQLLLLYNEMNSLQIRIGDWNEPLGDAQSNIRKAILDLIKEDRNGRGWERGDFSDHGSSAFSDPVRAGDPCYNAFDAREYAKSKTMNSLLGIDGLFGNMLAESAAEREGRRKCKEVRR